MKTSEILIKIKTIRVDKSDLYEYGKSIRLRGYNINDLTNIDMVAYPIELIGVDIDSNQVVLNHSHLNRREFIMKIVNGHIKIGDLIKVRYIKDKINIYNETVDKDIHVIKFNELGDYEGILLYSDNTARIVDNYINSMEFEN